MTWPGWWAVWTGCRWPSNWPRPGWRRWGWPRCWVCWVTGWPCWPAGTGWRPGGTGRWPPPRSGATGCWTNSEQRVFRWLSVFPAPFTLAAAEAVAGQDAAAAVLHLVECSLLIPPQPGPDGRLRYSMQQVLRSYGLGLLAETGEQASAEAALARYALQVAEEAAAGLWTIDGEAAAARWLDAEDATTAAVLAWAVEHDLDTALRLAAALGCGGSCAVGWSASYGLLSALADRAESGSSGWRALQWWIGLAMEHLGDPTQAAWSTAPRSWL